MRTAPRRPHAGRATADTHTGLVSTQAMRHRRTASTSEAASSYAARLRGDVAEREPAARCRGGGGARDRVLLCCRASAESSDAACLHLRVRRGANCRQGVRYTTRPHPKARAGRTSNGTDRAVFARSAGAPAGAMSMTARRCELQTRLSLMAGVRNDPPTGGAGLSRGDATIRRSRLPVTASALAPEEGSTPEVG